MKASKSILAAGIFLYLIVFLSGCPKFKSVTHANSVFIGDTLTLNVEIALNGENRNNLVFIDLIVPDRWYLVDTTLTLEGIQQLTPSYFSQIYGNGNSYRAVVNQYQYTSSETCSFQLKVLNADNLNSDPEEIIIRMHDDNLFNQSFQFNIRSIINDSIPTQLAYVNDQVQWRASKNNNGLMGYHVYADGELIAEVAKNDPLFVELLDGIHHYTLSAKYENAEIFSLDTLRLNGSQMLFVSPYGDDNNPGTQTEPLKSLEFAFDNISYDPISNKPLTVFLMECDYELDESINIPDNVSLFGAGPELTHINFNHKSSNLSYLDHYQPLIIKGMTISMHAGVGLRDAFFSDNPQELTLNNVWFFNTDTADYAGYLRADKISLEHVLVEGMRSSGFHLIGDSISIVHSNFISNENAIHTKSSHNIIINSIFYDNEIDIDTLANNEPWEPLDSTQVTVVNSVITKEWYGNEINNISLNPLFDYDAHIPYLLSDNSPAIDAGNSEYMDEEDPLFQGMALWPAKGTILPDLGIHGGKTKPDFVTNTDYYNQKTIKLFPNAVEDVAKLAGLEHGNYRITLFNQAGKLVLQNRQELYSEYMQIEVSSLKSGLYHGQVEGKNTLHSFRLLKK